MFSLGILKWKNVYNGVMLSLHYTENKPKVSPIGNMKRAKKYFFNQMPFKIIVEKSAPMTS
jgi:hypothetical protein